MSIFMKATIEAHANRVPELIETLTRDVFPIMESQGWRLHGCFVQRFGQIKPAIIVDLWEMEDMNHFDRVIKGDAYRNHPKFAEFRKVLDAAIISEELTFLDKKAGRIESLYP